MNTSKSRAVSRQPSAGFTIVETIIVLAIAGFILLMVLQILPTLVRNSRNNQRKQDVAGILEAVSHYEINDSGNFPNACGGAQPACTTPAGGGSPNDYFLSTDAKKPSFYAINKITLTPGSTTAPMTRVNPNDGDAVDIFNYQKCDPSGNGNGTEVGAGYNDVVALYAIESGSALDPKCQQL